LVARSALPFDGMQHIGYSTWMPKFLALLFLFSTPTFAATYLVNTPDNQAVHDARMFLKETDPVKKRALMQRLHEAKNVGPLFVDGILSILVADPIWLDLVDSKDSLLYELPKFMANPNFEKRFASTQFREPIKQKLRYLMEDFPILGIEDLDKHGQPRVLVQIYRALRFMDETDIPFLARMVGLGLTERFFPELLALNPEHPDMPILFQALQTASPLNASNLALLYKWKQPVKFGLMLDMLFYDYLEAGKSGYVFPVKRKTDVDVNRAALQSEVLRDISRRFREEDRAVRRSFWLFQLRNVFEVDSAFDFTEIFSDDKFPELAYGLYPALDREEKRGPLEADVIPVDFRNRCAKTLQGSPSGGL
jgi:hypothetical protein